MNVNFKFQRSRTTRRTIYGCLIEEFFESENVHSSTKILRKIFDAKYEKVDLNKVMNVQ